MSVEQRIRQAFDLATEQYAELGVDVNAALDRLAQIPISVHCWQGDDVCGFETSSEVLGGQLAFGQLCDASSQTLSRNTQTWEVTWPS